MVADLAGVDAEAVERPRPGFAVEFLRRNAHYRRDFARTQRQIARASVDAETARVSQTNSQYDVQVQSLQAAKKKLPETQQEVAQLRTQISVPNHLDDAFALAMEAADATKSTITKMTAADVEPFTARTTVGDGGKAEAAPAPAADTTTDASASASTTDAAASGSTASTAPAPAPSANRVCGRRIVQR